jgi:hypothetical protein
VRLSLWEEYDRIACRRNDVVRNLQSRQAWTLLIVAILANLILCIVLIFLFDWAVNQSGEPDVASMDEDPPVTAEATATETVAPSETPTFSPTAPGTPPPTLVATPAPTFSPEPTRREILEPTKPPYVFPTPIYIPPVPRVTPTSTPTRSR